MKVVVSSDRAAPSTSSLPCARPCQEPESYWWCSRSLVEDKFFRIKGWLSSEHPTGRGDVGRSCRMRVGSFFRVFRNRCGRFEGYKASELLVDKDFLGFEEGSIWHDERWPDQPKARGVCQMGIVRTLSSEGDRARRVVGDPNVRMFGLIRRSQKTVAAVWAVQRRLLRPGVRQVHDMPARISDCLELEVRSVRVPPLAAPREARAAGLRGQSALHNAFASMSPPAVPAGLDRDGPSELHADWETCHRHWRWQYLRAQPQASARRGPRAIGIDRDRVRNGHRLIASWFSELVRSGRSDSAARIVRGSMAAFYDWRGPKKSRLKITARRDETCGAFRKRHEEKRRKRKPVRQVPHHARHLGEALDKVRKGSRPPERKGSTLHQGQK